ncbi:MAG: hypothetical protein AAB373_02995 [Patescibacteria group bacterium]
MQLIKTYNQPRCREWPQNLIYFADQKDPPKPETAKSEPESNVSKTEAAYINKIHSKADFAEAKRIEPGTVDLDTLKELSELIDGPNKIGEERDTKDDIKYRQYFIDAVAKGKFPKKARHSVAILKALKSNIPEVKKKAQEAVKNLSQGHATEALSERKEQALLEELTDLEQGHVIVQKTDQFSREARTITMSADTREATEGITVKKGNWEVEAAPKEIVEEKTRIMKLQGQLAMKSNIIARKLDKERLATKPNQKEITEMEAKLKSLDQENEKLLKELQAPEKEWLNYMRRVNDGKKQIEYYSKKLGMDLTQTKRIYMWLIELTKGEDIDEKTTPLRIKGFKSDPVTGETTKEECYIQITSFEFAESETANSDVSGDIMIRYINENGKPCIDNLKMLFQFIAGFEGYEEIKDLKELNKRIGKNTGQTDLEVGQEFVKTLTEYDDKNNAIKKEETFKIEAIDEVTGKIKLDRVVTKINRNSMQLAVNDRLYYNRQAQEFNYGEFSKFIIQQNYNLNRDVKDAQEMCDRSVDAMTEECKGYIEGSSQEAKAAYLESLKHDAGTLDVPAQQGQSQEVVFLDENKLLRVGILSVEAANDNKETFVLREKRPINPAATTMAALRYGGIPQRLWGAQRPHPVDAWTDRTKQPDAKGNYPLKALKLSPVELADWRGRGIINNSPRATRVSNAPRGTRPTEGGQWRVNNDPNAIAAMNDASKHSVTTDSAAHEPATGGHHNPPGEIAGVQDNPGGADPGHQSAHEAGHAEGGHDEHAHAGHDEHDAHEGHEEHGHDDHGGGHDAHGGGHGHDDDKKYAKEALPYDSIYKVGGFERPESNFLKSLWVNTKFLSPSDLWTMGGSMIEYYERRFERNQKDRFARVGEEIPYFAPEMRRIIEATEHEAVHSFQEALEHKGIYEIRGRLRVTSNKDEFKACLEVLSTKGEMRWDDIGFWKNINRFTKAQFSVPIPGNGDPYTHIDVDSKDPRTGFDYIKDALDSIWGEGNYNNWFSKNKSSFSSNSKGFYEEGDQLESKEGGHSQRLAQLLKAHKEGVYVNPHEYEGLIHHMIENGKSTMQAKIYYIVEGVTAQNPSGETLLSFDRIGHFNSQHLAKFPILEYMTAGVLRKKSGEPDGKSHKWTLDDYKSWAEMFDGDNPKNCVPNKKVDDFMWDYIIPSDQTQDRINKALRSAENIDHDDMFAYIPPADEETIKRICGTSTGNKQYLTTEGYANVFPGFSQYMRTLSKTGKKEKLRKALRSYVRFEGIMTNKYAKNKDNFTRLDSSKLKEGTIVSPSTPPIIFIQQMNGCVQDIVKNYRNKFRDADTLELETLAARIYDPRASSYDIKNKDDHQKQDDLDSAYEKFGKVFEKVLSKDKGDLMMNTVEGSNFYGMPDFVSEAEKNRRKANKSTQYTDELSLE